MSEPMPTKDDLLAAIAAERRYWDALAAAVQAAGLMNRPGANNGPWTFRDMAAHLNAWRGVSVARLEAAQRGDGPPAHPWPGDWQESTDTDAINAWFLARDKERTAENVLAETQAQFDAMAAAVAAMPDDLLLTPGRCAWLGNLPVGPAVLGYSFTHLHADHAPDIRAWLTRATGGAPDLPAPPSNFGYGDDAL